MLPVGRFGMLWDEGEAAGASPLCLGARQALRRPRGSEARGRVIRLLP